MFAIGFLVGFNIVERMFRHDNAPEKWCPLLLLWVVAGTVIGARLGHVFFYEWDYYSAHPAEIIKTWHGGLASHGGTLGLMIALWLFVRKTGLRLFTVLDNIAIVTPICACAIRMGNLMNSEIIGRPTDVPWAFIFERIDQLPRHPGQFYEALCYALFFLVHWYFYRRQPQKVGTGFFFGLCLFLIFTARIFIEYTKENQVDFENGMLLNMGQLLSIPFVLLGAWCMWHSRKTEK